MSRSDVIRTADMHPGKSTPMISDSSFPVSDVNARSSLPAEPGTWTDRAPHFASSVSLAALRCALGRLASVVRNVAMTPCCPLRHSWRVTPCWDSIRPVASSSR
jgi:hypothetical protein